MDAIAALVTRLTALREIPEQQTVPEVESSNGAENEANLSRAPRLGVRLMIVILIGLALVAIYANIQKVRRDKIERVTSRRPRLPRHGCVAGALIDSTVHSRRYLSGARIGIVSLGQRARVGQGIDRVHALVSPNGFDARKAQSQTARMSSARLDRIERDLQNDVRLHFAIPAALRRSSVS